MILGQERKFVSFKEVRDYAHHYKTEYPFWLGSRNGFDAGVPQISCKEDVDKYINQIEAGFRLQKGLLKRMEKKPQF